MSTHSHEQDRTLNELAEDEDRWQHYLASGHSVPHRTVQRRLRKLAGEAAQKAEPR